MRGGSHATGARTTVREGLRRPGRGAQRHVREDRPVRDAGPVRRRGPGRDHLVSGTVYGTAGGSVEDLGTGAAQAGRAGEESTGRRSEEHTSELQSRGHLVCRLLREKKKTGKVGREIQTVTPW